MFARTFAITSAALWLLAISASAATIANWKQLNGGVSPTLAGLNTDSPTIGDGSAGDANSSWMAGRFGTTGSPASVTLAVGETLTVTGSLNLTGGSNTADQYRFGVFDDGGQFNANSGNNWTGGWMHVPGNDLYSARTDGAFISTGGNASNLGAGKVTTGTFSGDSTAPFTFSMSITRDSATTVDIVSSIIGGDGSYDQTYTVNDETTSLFTYTAFGFLIGGSSTADQVSFANVAYTVVPEPSALLLSGLGALLLLRRRR